MDWIIWTLAVLGGFYFVGGLAMLVTVLAIYGRVSIRQATRLMLFWPQIFFID